MLLVILVFFFLVKTTARFHLFLFTTSVSCSLLSLLSFIFTSNFFPFAFLIMLLDCKLVVIQNQTRSKKKFSSKLVWKKKKKTSTHYMIIYKIVYIYYLNKLRNSVKNIVTKNVYSCESFYNLSHNDNELEVILKENLIRDFSFSQLLSTSIFFLGWVH